MRVTNRISIKDRKGFTLVELLSVIGIIALLAALVFPVYSRLQTKSVEVQAVSQLKQIGTALNGYAGENSNFYPTARDTLPYTADLSDPEEFSWQQQLDPYIGFTEASAEIEGPREVFTLPEKGPYKRYGDFAFYLGSAAAMLDAQDGGPLPSNEDGFLPVNRLRVGRPDMHILAGEQGVPNFQDDDADRDDYNTNRPGFGEGEIDRKVQVLFVDGHVAAFDKFDPRQMTVRYEGTKANGEGYDYGEPLEVTP